MHLDLSAIDWHPHLARLGVNFAFFLFELFELKFL
jgi:hypothetical protein